RKGIADYFAPASISKSESGSGGVMGGTNITVNGAQTSAGSPPTTQDVTIPTVGKGEEGDEDTKGMSEGGQVDSKAPPNPDAKSKDGKVTGGSSDGEKLTKDEKEMVAAMKQEEQGFQQAEDMLKQALTGSAELKDFANQISVDRTPEGLRIQIIDHDKFSMFPSGGAVPYERARDLLLLVGKVISKLPNNISVTGHTDGTPFQLGSGRDNWTLSTERANVSREYLVKAGVDEKRVQRVSGLADRDPFVPSDPKDARNRRISIVLLRQASLVPPASDTPNPQVK
ncbi:MAG TPA: OmpA family protein, partial [Alphaproteobacteria bacterium]|nr:OmpA family protein [Alphaproteobacteria bacterium]